MAVAIYARQSVDKKDSLSIETQIELCRRELTPEEDAQVYHDKGYSGSNTNRPAFQKLLGDIRSGRIQRVIVYRLDRMSRSLLDFAKLIEFFDRFQTSFVSTQERFDTGTPMGRAMLSITMVFAQLERETIQQRIRDNYYARGEKGMFLGGPPPFGFECREERADGKKHTCLAPVPEEAVVVREMYRLYGLERKTLGETARLLNQSGYVSPTGKQWTGSRVGLTLRNPIYVCADAAVYRYYRERGCKITGEPELFVGTNGCYLYGKRSRSQRKYTDVRDHALSLSPSAGLVDAALFLSCQKRLDENRPLDNSGWGTITWLTGLVKCAACGYAATPKSSNQGRYYYFYCSGHRTGCCDVSGNLGSVKSVEEAVESAILGVAERYSDLCVELHRQRSRESEQLRGELETVRSQIERLLDRLADSGEVAAAYINQRLEALDRNRRTLERQLGEADRSALPSLHNLSSFARDWPALDVRQKNQLARLFLESVALSKDGMTLHWKHQFVAQAPDDSWGN